MRLVIVYRHEGLTVRLWSEGCKSLSSLEDKSVCFRMAMASEGEEDWLLIVVAVDKLRQIT